MTTNIALTEPYHRQSERIMATLKSQRANQHVGFNKSGHREIDSQTINAQQKNTRHVPQGGLAAADWQ
ncbi:MAG: hypothetical protein PUE55_03190 [Bacteroidales bacterium]|nr:hypothetical protein [Bacteroidales bacterium]